MNDVPLIQTPDTNSINTSIIAIKKQLRTINEALGLIDIPDAPDLSPYVKKIDVVDVVESGNMNPVTSNAVANSNAMPIDEVTSGNMHSVTSNAVANCFNVKTLWTGDCHTVGEVITLNENILVYKMLLFYVNVVPSRTPDYDILASVFLPEVHTICEFDLNRSMNSNYGGNASFVKRADNQFVCNRWDIYLFDSSYTSGLCRIVGVLK